MDGRTDRFPLFYRTLSPPVPSGAAAQKKVSSQTSRPKARDGRQYACPALVCYNGSRFPLFYRTSSPPVPSGAAAQKKHGNKDKDDKGKKPTERGLWFHVVNEWRETRPE